MKIIILGFGKDMERLVCDGRSGAQYNFQWNGEKARYEYEPKNPEEIDDLFLSQNIDSFFFFSVALDGQTIATAGKTGPAPAPSIPRLQYDDLTLDELRTLAADVGLETGEGDSEKTVKRLLDAFFLGEGRKRAGRTTEDLVDLDPPEDAPKKEKSKQKGR